MEANTHTFDNECLVMEAFLKTSSDHEAQLYFIALYFDRMSNNFIQWYNIFNVFKFFLILAETDVKTVRLVVDDFTYLRYLSIFAVKKL